jgi:tripeptidyl-peptidase-1
MLVLGHYNLLVQPRSHIYDFNITQATVEEAETLFQTTYHIFEHGRSSTPHVACDEYSVPSHISSHIDFVSPGVDFNARTISYTNKYFAADGTELLTKRSAMEKRNNHKKGPFHHMPRPAFPHWGPFENQICNTSFVTPVSSTVLLLI